jgi:CPA1 family monovalent cation:H+ antiporter
MHRLGLEGDDAVDREVRLAREQTTRAAASAMDGQSDRSELASMLRQIYEARLAGKNDGGATGELLRHAVAAQRRRLVELRNDGTIGDDAFHRVEEDLDWAELNAEAIRRRE